MGHPDGSSFDIPLLNIAQHTRSYGNYAIEIKKSWTIVQGASPILYVHRKSCFAEQTRKTLNISLYNSDTEENFLARITEVMPMFAMVKPYEGEDENMDGEKNSGLVIMMEENCVTFRQSPMVSFVFYRRQL